VTPPEVISLGETMVLLYPRDLSASLADVRELVVDVAGADSNFAIAMSRLGFRTGWISRVGGDPLGELVLNTIRHEGVDTSQVVVDPTHPTGLYVKYHPQRDGQPAVIYYRHGSAASSLNPNDVKPEYFTAARVLQVSGMTNALSRSCEEAVVRAIDLARKNNARVCLDLNLRLRLWSLTQARQILDRLLPAVSILSGTEEEYLQFFEKTRLVDALMDAHRRGPRTVVATRGARGAVALVGGRIVSHPGFVPPRVVDTVGAGDGFNAGFVASLLRGAEPEEALRVANRIGAAAVTTPGDFHGYPTWADLDAQPNWPERGRDHVDFA
jgi:2-dehydro-3-deoxygluconokinase